MEGDVQWRVDVEGFDVFVAVVLDDDTANLPLVGMIRISLSVEGKRLTMAPQSPPCITVELERLLVTRR